MSGLKHEQPAAGTNFDIMIAGVFGGVSGFFTERIIDYAYTKPPEWGVAASGLGVIALAFGGIAAHHWNRAFNATISGANPSHPAEK